MDLEIESIEVTVTGEDWDQDRIAREVRWHLTRALEEVSREELMFGPEDADVEHLEIPPIDWDAETDKTGRLVSLILEALEARLTTEDAEE